MPRPWVRTAHGPSRPPCPPSSAARSPKTSPPPKTERRFGQPPSGPLVAARLLPQIEVPLLCIPIDRLELAGRELEAREGAYVFADLLRAAGANQRAGHPRIAQHPGERHLRQALIT